MSTVTISPECEIVIPKEILKSMGLKPGQEIEVLHYDNRIAIVPIKPIEQMRGILRGIDTDVPRDEDRV